MNTEAMISMLMTLFSPFKRQCGDTFCSWPEKDCYRRGDFAYCDVLDLKRYIVPNFEEMVIQMCKNITQVPDVPAEEFNNETLVYMYISVCLNVLLLLVGGVLFILYLRNRRVLQKDTIGQSENISDETKELKQLHVVEKESKCNIHRVCNHGEDGTAKLLPSSNHNSYDIMESGCSCCTSTKTTE